MAVRTLALEAKVYRYLLECSSREPGVLARLRDATAKLPEAEMQLGADQGQLMGLLVRLMGARRCIEVGTFTGYSALAVALALPPDGQLIACDVSKEWTDIGRKFWREAGVEARIDLRLQPALKTLDELLARGERERFDFAFVDADKPNYIAYYEKLLELIRPGGLITVDNTLSVSGGPIVGRRTALAKALRDFNDHVHQDERVDLALLSIGEGLTLLRKRQGQRCGMPGLLR
jgi:caffeoyl-CoA O-methyltransferase